MKDKKQKKEAENLLELFLSGSLFGSGLFLFLNSLTYMNAVMGAIGVIFMVIGIIRLKNENM